MFGVVVVGSVAVQEAYPESASSVGELGYDAGGQS